MTSINAFIEHHQRAKRIDGLRLGQRFVNTYVRTRWGEMFYETNDEVAEANIRRWCAELQYGEELPPPVEHSNLPPSVDYPTSLSKWSK